MPSNGDSVLNLSSIPVGPVDDDLKSRSPDADPASPSRTPPDRLHNGTASEDDGPNESEAETVVLGPRDDRGEAKVIKAERSDDDNALHLHPIKETSRPRSPVPNGRRASRDEKTFKANGTRHGVERDPKSPVPTSPSSRTTSRHTKEISPTDSARSHAHSAASPPQPTGRGRSASAVESRKRKLRDESGLKASEPPRQKAKTEGLRDLRQPTSPATPGLGRLHKRSQSTQSLVSSATGRKPRETTSLAISTERNWTDDSSENSSPPHNLQHLKNHPARVKRTGHRALTSPARVMAHGRKVDRFGATRLARESEKGDLPAVQAAYEAAPDELDQHDFAGITPLQKAALHGWTDVVEYLIAKGCRTDCESNDRDTPLIDAVENGHLDVVKLLLNKGRVNPHHQNKKGQRAIDVLDHEVDDAEEIEAELKAAMRREVDMKTNDEHTQAGLTQTKSASRLLYNEYNTETLIEKAGDGDILAVGELINSNIKPNIACGVAASRGGHYDILSILLASGLKADPDPSKHSETPMLVAIGRGHLKIVNLLLEQDNFDPTRRNREGKAYWEISEERRGPKWEQERDSLKHAYDTFKLTHRSPRRSKKEPPHNPVRLKRKSSPTRRDRSSSPRPESKRVPLTKSASVSQAPPKSRRLMSGKEIANREKRRKRVVDDESTDEDSEDEVRAPSHKKPVKPRSFSEGEEHKPVKKIKARSEEHDVSRRPPRAVSHDSDHEVHQKPVAKIRSKAEKVHPVKSRMDTESADEKRAGKNKIRMRPLHGLKVKKRRASNDSIEESRVKKTPTASAKSTPAPLEKASTPDLVRERHFEEQKLLEKQAAEAKKKAEEEAAQKREQEEAAREAARKAAEEEAKRKAEAEAEAKRLEEAEAARKREEEEAKRRAEEEAKRLAELAAARQQRIERLPRALRRACELGNNRPLHFSGEELGISAIFLPIFYATPVDLQMDTTSGMTSKVYVPSFQVVGILGLPELDLAHLDEPYSSWTRIPFSDKHRDLLLRQYDVALLAQDYRFPMEGAPDFDYTRIQESIKEARQQFLTMEGLYWIEDDVLYSEVEKVESLHPLLEDIKDIDKRRRIYVADATVEAVPEKKHKPRKSFMDTVLAQTCINGTALKVNGEG